MDVYNGIFTAKLLKELFSPSRADDFFEALFGDASEGAFDINLGYDGYTENDNSLNFELELHERPGQCLACNLTYGLPEVFSRHPIINVSGLVEDIEAKLEDGVKCGAWKLGSTKQQTRNLHIVPLKINLQR